ncbi:MAG: carboxypeptidase regulatory-like domain-containing protein [bacterium]
MQHIQRFRLLALAATIAAAPLTLGAQAVGATNQRPKADTARAAMEFGTIDGIVSDTNLAPVRGAFVSIVNSRIRVGTGPNGRFRINKVPPGQYLVVVKRGGFRPASSVVDVPAQDTVKISYTLTEDITMLAPVAITAKESSIRMREFETRQKLGFGEFMNTAEIDKRNTVFATELFRRFGSINVSPSHSSANAEYYALSKREGGTISLGACPFTVYLDRVPLPTPFNLDLLPTPKDIAAIEVYSGASTIPPEFNGFNHGCGVILVWTKEGY